MSYFNKFPQVAIDVKGDTDLVMLTDITRKVRFSDLAKQNYIQYDFYDVVAGETPEYVASEFYGDPKLHWIVLMANDIIDVYDDWPMSVQNFEAYVTEKYDDVNDTHHYEVYQESGDTSKVIEIPFDPSNTIPVDAVTITNYEYEDNLQQKKRRIRLVKKQYVNTIKQELKSRLSGN